MTTDRSLQIRRLEPSDAALYREIRLEGLRISPEAFGSTFEKEDAQPLSWFEAVAQGDALGHVRAKHRKKSRAWEEACCGGSQPRTRTRRDDSTDRGKRE